MPSPIYVYEAPFLSTALGQLKDYLLSNEIFWNLGLKSPQGFAPYPQLSLGNLLLSYERLLALRTAGLLPDEHSDEFVNLDLSVQTFSKEWQTAWSGKAEKEFGVRLRQWARFLDELSTSRQGQAGSFTHGLRIRAMLQLLLFQLPQNETSLQSELTLNDQRFKHLSNSGDFVWENELEGHFSPKEYWFLRTQFKRNS